MVRGYYVNGDIIEIADISAKVTESKDCHPIIGGKSLGSQNNK